MSKAAIVVIILALVAGCALGCSPGGSSDSATGEGIEWLTDWTQALEKAQSENKPLAIYFYTDVCPSCRKVEQSVFTDAEVGDFFNKSFVPLKSNAGRSTLYRKYGISAVPTIVFSSPDGYEGSNEIARITGAKAADEFVQVGQSVLDQWPGLTSTIQTP
jgi:thiol:disulfide interchange protein